MKISNPVTWSLVLLVAAISASSHWASYRLTDDLLYETLHRNEAGKANTISKLLETLTLADIQRVQLTARLTAKRTSLGRNIAKLDTPEALPVIRNVLNDGISGSGIGFLEVTDRQEILLYRTQTIEGIGKPAVSWGVFEALAGTGMLSSSIESGQLTLRATEPVYAGKEVVGALSAGIAVSAARLREISQDLDGNTALLSLTGKILAASNNAELNIDSSALAEAFSEKIPIFRHGFEQHRTQVYFPIMVVDTAYMLFVDINSAPAYQQHAAADQRAMLTAVGLTLISIVLSILLLRWIMHPLFKLRERAKAMALELTGTEIDASSHGEIGAVVSAMETLTDRLAKQNTELRNAAVLAEAANRSKCTFIANMSHELRTPMNAIIGMTHMLKRNNNDPGQQDKLGKVSRAADHLLRLLNDVLDLSKMDAERMVLESAEFTVGAVMRNLESMTSGHAEGKGLKLFFNIDHPLLQCGLYGDALRLQQVLVNLVGNAIKFTKQGSITLRARILDESNEHIVLEFSVADTGIGVARNVAKKIFDPFEQADGSTTRQYGGSGLGLTISQRFIELMGGEIQLTSTLGLGSVFSFTLRFAKAMQNAAPIQDIATSGAEAEKTLCRHFQGTRVLVAEDDWVNQEVVRELLVEVLGFQVDFAEDGERALAIATKNDYALILMDMQMPEMDGLDATRCIRQLPGYAFVPIIAMTANAFAEDRALCMDAGMNDFLSKPVNPDVLFVNLLKWLRSSTKLAA